VKYLPRAPASFAAAAVDILQGQKLTAICQKVKQAVVSIFPKFSSVRVPQREDLVETLQGLDRKTTGDWIMAHALAEEVLKMCFPVASRYLIGLEFILGCWTHGFKAAVFALIMHISTMLLHKYVGGWMSLCFGTGVHFSYNAMCLGNLRNINMKVGDFYSTFYQAYVSLTRVEPVDGGITKGNMFLPAVVPLTIPETRGLRGYMSISYAGAPCSLDQLFEMLPEVQEIPRHLIYGILVTNAMMYQPYKCTRSLLVAMLHRLHANPHEDMDLACIRHERWLTLALEMRRGGVFLGASVQNLLTVEECAVIMGGQRGLRISTAYKQALSGYSHGLKKTITLKWNETLPLKSGDLRPRCITSLDPASMAMVMPWARAITETMHVLFDVDRVHNVGGIPVVFVFAAGSTPTKLNAIGKLLSQGLTVVAVAGDDSFVSWGTLSPLYGGSFGEADQSKFDQSQDEGPLKYAREVWMSDFGVPTEVQDLLYAFCTAPYSVKSKNEDLRIRGEAGVQMPTGTPVTTCQSSMNTIFMFWYAIFHRKPVVQAARELGFSVKYKAHECLESGTFLRGWWIPGINDEFVWTPLPSAVLKLGKVLTNPMTIAQTVDYGKAVRMCAWSLYKSYGTVPLHYPILGAFLKALQRMGISEGHISENSVIEDAAYKTKQVVGSFARDVAMNMVCARYGLTEEQIQQCEQLCDKVDDLPAYIEHSVFMRLLEVDYA
jgi:hypothetical protein